MTEPAVEVDASEVERARDAPGLLRAFNDAGVLSSADIHVALRLAGLAAEEDPDVLLAAALAVRGPRTGHVYVDLATIRDTATVDADEPVDLSTLPWPEPEGWVVSVGSSALVAVGEEDVASVCPLRLAGSALYLDRYWREERQVAADIRTLSDAEPAGVRVDALAEGVGRLFGRPTDADQRLAAASAVLRRFAVVAGGPGTGKTTTVAGIAALLMEQALATEITPPLIALAAPTGKAAARLEESVHEEAARLSVDDDVRARLAELKAMTLHRLLGSRPDSHSRFRHDRSNRLPYDVVVVDETSMVSLSMMARLLEAVRPEARLILAGDPGQLTSIEAGAVLGDIVGPATSGLVMRSSARDALAAATGEDVEATDPPEGVTVGDGIVVLKRVHRFGGGIAAVADAIRRGDPDAVIEALHAAGDDVEWIPVDAGDREADAELRPVRDAAVAAGRAVIEAARDGRAVEALAALGSFRLLCAHRRGHHGVATWMARVEAWLTEHVGGFGASGQWYVGRPLLVTENDYGLRLYNGDTGAVVADGPDRVSAAFKRQGEIVRFSPTRLEAVETVYAMTIHKSQGSQFETAAVLLPKADSQVLTRELLYTAVTRARERLIVVGAEDVIRAAVERPVARASGLRKRLWGS